MVKCIGLVLRFDPYQHIGRIVASLLGYRLYKSIFTAFMERRDQFVCVCVCGGGGASVDTGLWRNICSGTTWQNFPNNKCY